MNYLTSLKINFLIWYLMSAHKKNSINTTRSKKRRVLLTSAPGALVKEPKSSKFYIEKNITYTLKKLATQVPRQFYRIWIA
jgi:hypothetical protein